VDTAHEQCTASGNVEFTGLRRQEAATLRWSGIDLDDRSFTMTDTKNREPLTLHLTDVISDLLKNRKAATDSEFVFAGDGKAGYLIEPRRQVQKVIESTTTFIKRGLNSA